MNSSQPKQEDLVSSLFEIALQLQKTDAFDATTFSQRFLRLHTPRLKKQLTLIRTIIQGLSSFQENRKLFPRVGLTKIIDELLKLDSEVERDRVTYSPTYGQLTTALYELLIACENLHFNKDSMDTKFRLHQARAVLSKII